MQGEKQTHSYIYTNTHAHTHTVSLPLRQISQDQLPPSAVMTGAKRKPSRGITPLRVSQTLLLNRILDVYGPSRQRSISSSSPSFISLSARTAQSFAVRSKTLREPWVVSVPALVAALFGSLRALLNLLRCHFSLACVRARW